MILVTGGAGYIGSHFVKAYLTQNPGDEIVVVDNLVEGHKEALNWGGDESKRIHLVESDIGDKKAMRAAIDKFKPTAVVHFAGYCYVGDSEEHPDKYFSNNVIGTLNFLEVLGECGVKKFVFSSSCATYGDPIAVPMDESHPQNPVSVYGLTKYMVEKALHAYSRTKGWSSVCLRYFNAAGADDSGLLGESHEPETHLIPRVLKAAKGEIKELVVYGNDYPTKDGTCIRDYVHINDLADAHLKALDLVKKQKGFEAINLGTAHGASVKEIIDLCEQVTGKKISVKMDKRRPGDVPSLIANSQKAKAMLSWQPKYDLKATIETAWRWEQERRY